MYSAISLIIEQAEPTNLDRYSLLHSHRTRRDTAMYTRTIRNVLRVHQTERLRYIIILFRKQLTISLYVYKS